MICQSSVQEWLSVSPNILYDMAWITNEASDCSGCDGVILPHVLRMKPELNEVCMFNSYIG